eukprot:CAMPEP_0116127962 /NCGR_PEP_ID=MMETSP0329-20121206/7111_1 /TAXON_ID=697910 /ORGANISM="Pseudo-nitzschia arenysensis, Strain B593" /LENGTH=240 /DNA_ID=CAMNT_0003622079 /DNA_START=54 /DNA_END=776 /DNA_ORIENTATION=+
MKTSKSLKVVEKFRAKAALYIPSKWKGGGWLETSGPDGGGEAIIQLQENADIKENRGLVPVVRFQLRHGKDVLNARILGGLPLRRKDKHTVYFKALSSTTSGIRRKTVHVFKFIEESDADDFEMWWYAKNGSLNEWIKAKKNKKQGSSKRKATDPTNSSFTPLKKKLKATKDFDANQEPNRDDSLQKLSTALSFEDDSSGKSNAGNETDGSSDDEDVFVDSDDAPQSQQWFVAFEDYSEE